MLAEAEATDSAEDAAYGVDKRGDEIPEELRPRVDTNWDNQAQGSKIPYSLNLWQGTLGQQHLR